jgi:branched-subunit amino acid transport protein
MTWGAVVLLIVGTWFTRALGMMLGELVGRSAGARQVLALAPLAMMSALVVVGSEAVIASTRGQTAVSPEALGIVVGLLAFLLRAPFFLTFISVIGVTAVARAIL